MTDIYATSTDYDPRAKMTKLFFATVQNKMHYAVHEHTAAELIYERVNNEKPFVGCFIGFETIASRFIRTSRYGRSNKRKIACCAVEQQYDRKAVTSK